MFGKPLVGEPLVGKPLVGERLAGAKHGSAHAIPRAESGEPTA